MTPSNAWFDGIWLLSLTGSYYSPWIGHRKHFRKWFSNYHEAKKESSEYWKKTFFIFWQVFMWRSWNRFLRKQHRVIKEWFWSYFGSKTNVLSLGKWYVSLFRKFLSGEVEIIFWENQAKHSNLFKFKVSHRNHFKKWFQATLKLKMYVLNIGQWHFSLFCKFLINKVEVVFWEVEAERSNPKVVIGSILENGFEATLSPKYRKIRTRKTPYLDTVYAVNKTAERLMLQND